MPVLPCGDQTIFGTYPGCLTQIGQLCACYNDPAFYNEVSGYIQQDECEVLSRIKFGSNDYLINDPSNTSGETRLCI